MSPLPSRPSALRFLRDHPPMILGVIVLHMLALHALIDTRWHPVPMPFYLRPSMTVLKPAVVPPPLPAPVIEPTAPPSPAPDMRRSPRANAAPSRSTAVRQVDRSTGGSARPEATPAQPAAIGIETRRPAEAAPPPLDPAATARAINEVARHPLLPGTTHEAPMNFGDKLARDLGSDERVTEEHLNNGVIRFRSGNHCVLVSPSRTADPFTQANSPMPKLTTSCDRKPH